MALIPYRDVPETENLKKDPPFSVAGQPVEEFYCGDHACDCATAHLRVGGVVMTVDLGTQRVDFLDNQNAPGRETLRKGVRDAIQSGQLDNLRKHYADTREFGKTLHFRYFDWSGVKPGEMVLWQHVFRAEGIPLFTMTSDEKPGEDGTALMAMAEMPRFLRFCTWSFMRETKGEITKVVPPNFKPAT